MVIQQMSTEPCPSKTCREGRAGRPVCTHCNGSGVVKKTWRKAMACLQSRESKRPQQPIWFERPRHISLPIETIVDGPFPEEELAISFRSNSEIKSAVVPSEAVNRIDKTVHAMVVGKSGDFALVALPGTSSGGTIALIPINKVAEFAAS